MSDATDLKTAIGDRQVEEVLHFTTNCGVLGIFAVGAILPRADLAEAAYLKHVYKPNASTRKDNDWLDHVSLSISRVNTEFFGVSRRWHSHSEVWWAVVSLNPEILQHPDVNFATTNNIYPACRRCSGPEGFQALFADPVFGRYSYRHERTPGMPRNWTTDVQAEVLYPGPVATKHLRAVYVVNDTHGDIVSSQYDILRRRDASSDPRPELPIDVRPELFE